MILALKRIAGGLFWLVYVLALLATATISVAGSEAGTRWLLTQVPAWAGVDWRYGASDGTLLGQLRLGDVELRQPGLAFSARELVLEWRPRALFGGLVQVVRLDASGVRLDLPAAETGAETTPGSAPLALPPLRLRVERLTARDVVVIRDERELSLPSLAVVVDADAAQLELSYLAVRLQGFEISGRGRLGMDRPQRMEAELAWRGLLEGNLPLRGRAGVAGTLGGLAFELEQTAPATARARGELVLDGEQPRVQASADWQSLQWPLSGPPEWLSETGQLRIDGNPDAYQVEAKGRVQGPGLATTDFELRGEGDRQGLDIQHLPLSASPARLDLRGRVDWAPAPRLDLSAEWQSLQWPMQGAAIWHSPDGRLQLAGDLDAYRGRVEAALSGPQLPQVAIRGEAEGGGSALVLKSLELKRGPGRLLAEVSLDWSAAPRARVDGSWQQMRWPLAEPPLFDSRKGRFQVAGWLDGFDLQLQADLAADWLARIETRWSGRGNAAGLELARIEVDHAGTRLRGQGGVDWRDGFGWRFAGDWQALRWPLDTGDLLASPSGRLDIQGQGAEYGLELAADLRLPGLPELASSARASGDAAGLAVDALELRHERTRIQGRGRVDWRGPVQISADGRWQDLQWPLDEAALVSSPNGQFSLSGEPGSLSLDLDGPVALKGAPPIPALALRSVVEPGGLTVRELRARLLDGNARLSGRLNWAPAVDWDLALSAEQLDPAALDPRLPGRIALAARVAGDYRSAESMSVRIGLSELDGRLRDQPVRGRGEFTWQPGRLEVVGGQVELGTNRLDLDGRLDSRPAFKARLAATDLNALWPDLRGRLTAELDWDGPLERARLRARAEGDDLGLGGLQAERLELSLDQLPDQAEQSTLSLRLLEVAAGLRLQSLTLQGQGLPEAHRLDLKAEAIEGRLEAQVSGAWRQDHWRADLTAMRAELVESGTWALDRPAGIDASAEGLRLSQACLGQNGGSICAESDWRSGGDGSARFEFDSVPLESIDGWIAADLRLTGTAKGEVALRRLNGSLAGELRLGAEAGSVDWVGANLGKDSTTAFRDAELTARLADDRVESALRLLIADQGRIEGRLEIGRADANRPLDGTFEIDLPDLAFLAELVPDLESAGGRARLRTAVGGNLARPLVTIDAGVEDGSAKLAGLGVEIKDIRLQARQPADATILIEGSMTSGPGKLELNGRIDPRQGQEWPFEVQVIGEAFEVADTIDTEILVSPDLRVRAAPGRLDLSGDLRVPLAEIEIRGIQTNAVSPSADEVIVGDSAAAPVADQTERRLAVTSDVELRLGEDVRFAGFGLQTRLTGNLRLNTAPGRPPSAQGALDLQEGRYRAYGQNLQIQRGQLVFVGPVDNPAVDLRAVRQTSSVTAGLAVSGTLRKPVTRVFSDPPMAESDALAYLLTGGPSAGANQRDQAILAQAALSFGLKQALPVTRQLEEAFDLEEFTLSGNTDSEESALLIGKYLTPDLYVRYSYGLIDRVGGLLMRYRINQELALEARSGAAQALDLIYTIDTE